MGSQSILISIRNYLQAGRASLFKGEWSLKGGTLMMILVYLLRGILSYLYLYIAVRLLGTIVYGSFSVLYSGFTMVAFILGQSFETLISKYTAEAVSKHLSLRNLFKKIGGIFGIITIIVASLALITQKFIATRLFSEDLSLFWFMICIGIGESIDMTARGVLRGLRAIGLYGASFAINMALRFLTLILFVNVFDMGLIGAAIGLLLTMAVSILININFYLIVARASNIHQAQNFEISNNELHSYIFSMLWMFVAMALYYHSGPMLIKAQGGEIATKMAGMFMLATYLTRIPAQLGESLTVNLLPHFANISFQADREKSLDTIRKSFNILIPLGILSVVSLYLLGPWILNIFSDEYNYSRNGIMLLAINGFMIILMNVLSQLLLSRSKTRQVAFAWFAGCGIFFGASFLPGLPMLTRLELGYLVSSIIMFIIVFTETKAEIYAK
jgi:O-antigen/teichoic acid export membrane protein